MCGSGRSDKLENVHICGHVSGSVLSLVKVVGFYKGYINGSLVTGPVMSICDKTGDNGVSTKRTRTLYSP